MVYCTTYRIEFQHEVLYIVNGVSGKDVALLIEKKVWDLWWGKTPGKMVFPGVFKSLYIVVKEELIGVRPQPQLINLVLSLVFYPGR